MQHNPSNRFELSRRRIQHASSSTPGWRMNGVIGQSHHHQLSHTHDGWWFRGKYTHSFFRSPEANTCAQYISDRSHRWWRRIRSNHLSVFNAVSEWGDEVMIVVSETFTQPRQAEKRETKLVAQKSSTTVDDTQWTAPFYSFSISENFNKGAFFIKGVWWKVNLRWLCFVNS